MIEFLLIVYVVMLVYLLMKNFVFPKSDKKKAALQDISAMVENPKLVIVVCSIFWPIVYFFGYTAKLILWIKSR